jgi:hypothetical protein
LRFIRMRGFLSRGSLSLVEFKTTQIQLTSARG